MVSETYVECLVAKKPNFGTRLLKTLLIMLTVCFVLIGMLFAPGFLIAIVTGIGAYFAYMNADIEYEYLYLDKEITIDKVMAKSKRKKAATYDINHMDILAPVNSHRLDSYKNRNGKIADYSSGTVEQPDKRYMMVLDGEVRVIFEPNEEMIKAIQTIAPRKVFND
ncbi:MAG: hypothetical protein J6B68_06055 [Lachnospiraceae bacterium]|nr:hypothetical protein [Lachnospiraceae bacterium]